MIVTIAGLNPEELGDVVVTGPTKFEDTIKTTTTLTSLKPGTYNFDVLTGRDGHDGI